MRVLFLLFILVPILEITVLIQVGQAIGVWYTLALVLLSAFVGVNMLRHQGLSTLARARQRMDQGEVPGQEMVEGIVLAVGGALLVTPGFVTDVVGFSCLLPGVRRALVRALLERFTVVVAEQTVSAATARPSAARPNAARPNAARPNAAREGEVIEGEYTRRD